MARISPRLRVVLSTALLLLGVAMVLVDARLLIAAIIPGVFLGYGVLVTAPPVAENIAVRRTVTPAETRPGGTANVQLTVENTGTTQLTEVRVADGVPKKLAVTDGSPRGAVRLSPGETATISYTLRVRYGTARFDAATVCSLGLGGIQSKTVDIEPEGDRHVTATVTAMDPVRSQQTTGAVGQQTTDQGGEGTEFHSIRSYQPTDPVNRIAWRQYAKARELSTVKYRQEEAINTVVVVDVRKCTQQAKDVKKPTGTELCIHAANQLITKLLEGRSQVGVAIIGVETKESIKEIPTTSKSYFWFPPGKTHNLLIKTRRILDLAGEAVTATDPELELQNDIPPQVELAGKLDGQTQGIVITPLCDDTAVNLVETLQKTAYDIDVVTPDTTGRDSTGARFAQTRRNIRIHQLQKRKVTVLNWQPETQSLSGAISARAQQRSRD